ncbi:MAG TPA: hypothetical protein VGL82_19775 [Bryobacteraceae bacterium]|jgi:hypothetical protein
MADIQFSNVLKWVGYATAILSLIAGVRGLTKVFTDRAEVRRQVGDLLASEQIQLQGRDFAAAWQSLDRASKLDAGSPAVRTAQENLAMQWLEEIRVQDNEKFSDIAEKLDPVLTRGIAAEKAGQRQADLLAHLGWSYFLRSREGKGGLDPAASYADAVKKDANNPYAQSMWGHWILWNRGDPEDAGRHFTSALASGREREFVRSLQLAALLNENNDPSEEEIVRVVTAMHKEGTSIPLEMRRRIFSMYYGKLIPPNTETPRFVNAVPPPEHVATFRWAFAGLDLDNSESLLRAGDLSVLEEAAGQLDEARNGYESIRKQLSGQPGSLLTAAETGSRRLTHTQ